MSRIAAVVAGVFLALGMVSAAEAKMVRATLPGGLARVEFDDILWKPQIGGKVLFLTCKHDDCGGARSECSLSTQKTSGQTTGDGIREALVLGMEKQLIAQWTGYGATGMATVEQPRHMMHGDNMGAYATFRATWKDRPTLLTFFMVPTDKFNVSATCFTAEDLGEAVWQIYGVLSGIKIGQPS
jgi:hypothetical protein